MTVEIILVKNFEMVHVGCLNYLMTRLKKDTLDTFQNSAF